MPGRRYGGFMVGDKYVRTSRRHQVQGSTDAWVAGLGQLSIILLMLFQLAIYIGTFILLLMLLQAFGWPPKG